MQVDRRTLPVCVESPMVIDACGHTLGFSDLMHYQQVKMFEFAHTFIDFLINKCDKTSARVRDSIEQDFNDEERSVAIMLALNILKHPGLKFV